MDPNVKPFIPGNVGRSRGDDIPSFLTKKKRVLKLPYRPKKKVDTTSRSNIVDEDKPWLNSLTSANNQLLTKEYIEGTLSSVIGKYVKINNIDGYQLAFVHKSFLKRDPATLELCANDPSITCIPKDIMQYKPTGTYERLEFLGDSFLGCVVADLLYKRFPSFKQDQGFLTTVRSKLVRHGTLARFSRKLGFENYMLISAHIEDINGRNNDRILEDIFESFLGALSLDLGFYAVQDFLVPLIETTIDFATLIRTDDNHKAQLLNFFQTHGWGHPIYIEINREGPPHNCLFTVGVAFPNDDLKNIMQTCDKNISSDTYTIKEDSDSDNDSSGEAQKDHKYNGTEFISISTAPKKKVNAEQTASKEALRKLKALEQKGLISIPIKPDSE